MVTLEVVLSPWNLTEALRQVRANKGAPGVDNMTVEELEPYLRSHPHLLSQAISDGTYRPSPIKRVYIPKDNGEKRPLGIPTVTDRLVQQAISQILSIAFDRTFSETSFGFRPGRSAHDALKKALQYLEEGNEFVIDLDLAKFFDTVNHSKMIQVLSDKIKDGRVISLIHRFLRAPIEENGKLTKAATQGLAQGGPLSPICANLLLDELDKKLEERGIRFCRYADDMIMFFSSLRSAQRAYQWIKKFINKRLFLQINEEKTKICHASEDVKFLGHTFYRHTKTDDKDGKWGLAVHHKSIKKFQNRIRTILDRKCPKGLKETKEELTTYIRGWANYFFMGLSRSKRRDLDQWIRRRIRQMYWKIWKRPRTRIKALIQFGIPENKAYEWGNSSKGYWRIAGSWVLATSLRNAVLSEKGGWKWIESVRTW